jgi:hypothetical protein
LPSRRGISPSLFASGRPITSVRARKVLTGKRDAYLRALFGGVHCAFISLNTD